MSIFPRLPLALLLAVQLTAGSLADGKIGAQDARPQPTPSSLDEETLAIIRPQVRKMREATKGEVDSLLESLKKRNVRVLDRCLENCKKSGGTVEDQIVSKPQPVYPPEARARRIAGEVVVRIVVDEQGRVAGAQAVSGEPMLREAAAAAAKQARFRPTKLSGQSVKVTGTIQYNFVLQ